MKLQPEPIHSSWDGEQDRSEPGTLDDYIDHSRSLPFLSEPSHMSC